jgi:two-component system response regulator RegA
VNTSITNGNVPGRSLLLAHEPRMCEKLGPALGARGFDVRIAHTAAHALALAAQHAPRYAVVALKLPDQSGLRLIAGLHGVDPTTRIVVVTAYPSIETAVEAIKLGAVHYLATPVSADRLILAMLQDAGNADIALRDRPMSVHRITWEYIHHVLHENRGNISATARALSIDRRTLQRKLRKRPVAE